ncbi:MAG: TylF/MycF family methyltransferase [Treponema sp.]|jgi:O-methyltransferase|nr:TylF/MycF family methyltransferase [Treponema sp.]
MISKKTDLNIPGPMRLVLFGAGQYGQALYRILDREVYQVIGFADNKLAGSTVLGLRVYAAEELAGLNPHAVMFALKGRDRRAEIAAQMKGSGLELIPPPLDAIDIRGAELKLLAKQIKNRNVAGSVAELGVYKGDFALLLAEHFPGRPLYLFDTFTGFPAEDVSLEPSPGSRIIKAGDFADTSFEGVSARFSSCDKVHIIKGRFPETAGCCEQERFCFVSLDADLYQPVYEGLRFFYPRLESGGCILIDDAASPQYPGAGKALRVFCEEENLFPLPLCDVHGSAVLIRGSSEPKHSE